MRNWRQLTAALGGAVLIVGGLGLGPGLAATGTLRAQETVAAGPAGGIEIWGSSAKSLPEADGPWSHLGAHQGVAAAGNQLAIRADGTLQALPGTAAGLANIPSAVAGTTVVDAGISHPQMAWAVTSDGNLHKWGGARGSVIPDQTFTPAGLGAPGRSVVEASGAHGGSSFLVRFDDGSVTFVDALGPFEPKNDGASLTGVTSLAADATGKFFALRSDGSVAVVDAAGWTIAVPADAADPIVSMAMSNSATNGGSVVRASGAVQIFTATGASPDTSFEALTGIDGRPVQVARVGRYAAVLTDTGEVYAWQPTTDGVAAAPAAFQPPASLEGMDVLEIGGGPELGGNGVFRAIVTEGDDPQLPDLEVNTQPTIAGDPTVGKTLTATPATFSETDGVTITHQWLADGEAIDGATGATYLLTATEEGATITYVSTATRAADNAKLASDPSNALGPVAAGFQIIEEPKIEGDPFIGEPVVAILAATNRPGDRPTNTIQWQSGDGETFENIEGATKAILTLTEALDGKFVRYIQTAKLGNGTTTSRESEVKGPVREAPVELAVVEQPTISGTGTVGQTLTATPATFNDDIGVTLTHQWYADDEVIEGQTGTTLTLDAAQQGTTITYATTAKRAADAAEVTSDRSNEIGPIEGLPLAALTPPSIAGTPKVGETLTGTPATFNDTTSGVTVTNQWLADGEAIDGATGTTLELAEAQLDAEITFRSTATRDGDDPVSSESEAVGPVLRADVGIAVDSPPSIAGTAKVGETLTGTPATFTGDTEGDPTNQWLANGVAINGETGLTLDLTDAQAGKVIAFRSTQAGAGGPLSSTSEPTAAVQALLKVGDKPAIAGTATVGKTLTGTPATFTGDPDAVTNQWLADGEAIDGATNTTLLLTDALKGKKITFASTATRAGDTPVTSTSNATNAVAAADDGEEPGEEPGDGDGDTPGTPDKDLKGKIEVVGDNSVEAGDTLTVKVGKKYAGQDVTTWLFSTPRKLGTSKVAADGTIRVVLPRDVPAGVHSLAVYDSDGELIGYDTIRVAAAGGGDGLDRVLPDTGSPASMGVWALGLAMILAGLALLSPLTRRRSNVTT